MHNLRLTRSITNSNTIPRVGAITLLVCMLIFAGYTVNQYISDHNTHESLQVREHDKLTTQFDTLTKQINELKQQYSMLADQTKVQQSAGSQVEQLQKKTNTLDSRIDELSKSVAVRASTSTSSTSGKSTTHSPECMYPIVTLMSAGYCQSGYVLYQSMVRVARREKYTTCLTLMYEDKNLTDYKQDLYDWNATPNPYPNDGYCAALDAEAAANGMSVEWYAMPPLKTPDWFIYAGTNWGYSFAKIQAFGFLKYKRFLFLDSDQALVRSLDKIFEDSPLDKTIVGIPDQAGGCNHRRSINGGFLMIQPSVYLYAVAMGMVFEKEMSCLGGKWRIADQEIVMCMCGYDDGHEVMTADNQKVWVPGLIMQPPITCQVLPVYNQIWPAVWSCADVKNSEPWRIIHYMAHSKPWNLQDGKRPTDTFSNYWWCLHDKAYGVTDMQTREDAILGCKFEYPEGYTFAVPQSQHI